jgi:hypothetical protein
MVSKTELSPSKSVNVILYVPASDPVGAIYKLSPSNVIKLGSPPPSCKLADIVTG